MAIAETAHAASALQEDVLIIATADDKQISAQKMAERLVGYDVVFFGEFHDQDILHALEYEVMQELYALHGDKLVLSMEMFDVDVQHILNEYLTGKISEEEFIANARPWPRYQSDYRRLVEFAKTHNLPVIAGNVPRFLAAKLAKEGTLDTIEEQYKPYIPAHTYTTDGKYKEKFVAYMDKGEAPMRISKERINQVFAAQCIKDDKMAASIYGYLKAYKHKVIYHVNGCFHSDGHLGTVKKLQALNGKLKIAVITPKNLPLDKDYLQTYSDDKKDGEFIVYFPK